MSNLSKTLGLGIVFMVAAGLAWAEPMDGFSIGVGQGLYEMTVSDDAGGSNDYTSEGTSIYLDYLFESGTSSWSFFYMLSEGEATESTPLVYDISEVAYTYTGLEYRLWSGAWYLGGHVGAYAAELTTAAGTATASGSGYGAVLGIEGDSGMYLHVAYDLIEMEFSNGVTEGTGTRIYIGYRFR